MTDPISIKKMWYVFKTVRSADELDDVFLHQLPRSKVTSTVPAYSSKANYCCFSIEPNRHKTRCIRRCCVEKNGCPVKYKCVLCDVCSRYQIKYTGEHKHPVELVYDHHTGIGSKWKPIILSLITKGKLILGKVLFLLEKF
jgi:hypothetical protein